MAFYTSIPNSKEVSVAQFTTTLRQVDPTIGVAHIVGEPNYRFKKATAWTGPQIQQLQNAFNAQPATTDQERAQDYIDSLPLIMLAIIFTILDQINLLRTNVGLPTVSTAQMIQAIKSRAATIS